MLRHAFATPRMMLLLPAIIDYAATRHAPFFATLVTRLLIFRRRRHDMPAVAMLMRHTLVDTLRYFATATPLLPLALLLRQQPLIFSPLRAVSRCACLPLMLPLICCRCRRVFAAAPCAVTPPPSRYAAKITIR